MENTLEVEKISQAELIDLQQREQEEDYSLEDVKKYLEVNAVVNHV